MASVIIPVKTKDNISTSVSIDEDLYLLLACDFPGVAECRAWIREEAARYPKSYSITRMVRIQALHRIAKPSLVKKSLEIEGQIDIEEI
ncbi:hypothetical protein MO867_17485 [Microbulbifer sp. OS29]|uniref:Uncharacterized protein n=1 Tax=Microbulbifer okhotskensis TaxID=2926617 RepID=A0A9X2EPM5_9GAMM|nr:hypothetical protein [Microbulbifer okhotskensis]MCO1336127.1 hypothetical protein [Microbulbifer okhotskensis]